MVLTGLLESHILAGNTTVVEITEEFDKAHQSRTGHLWVDCFIAPLIIHLYLHAEEGNWLLHIYALKRMIPHFCSWPLELCEIHIMACIGDDNITTRIYSRCIPARRACLSSSDKGFELCLSRSVWRANPHPVWEVQRWTGRQVFVF